MSATTNFLIAFVLSFAGSIPPGTINLTVIQLGLENKVRIALRFAIAASIIEYPYAWIAVRFQRVITASPVITENLQIISALVLIVLGVINVWPRKTDDPSALTKRRFSQSGYRRGFLLGILNPLAIPYWIGITAYLKGQDWIDLSSQPRLHSYLAGVTLGAFALLVCLAYLSGKVMSGLVEYPWIRKVPGFLLLALGLYAIADLMVSNLT